MLLYSNIRPVFTRRQTHGFLATWLTSLTGRKLERARNHALDICAQVIPGTPRHGLCHASPEYLEPLERRGIPVPFDRDVSGPRQRLNSLTNVFHCLGRVRSRRQMHVNQVNQSIVFHAGNLMVIPQQMTSYVTN